MVHPVDHIGLNSQGEHITYESQDAEAEVVCHGRDDCTHAQHSQGGIASRNDQVACQIPENIPAEQVTLKTLDTQKLRHFSWKMHRKFCNSVKMFLQS